MKHILFGAADEVLLFAIAVRSFGRVGAGVAAALLLLVTPAHAFSATASPGIRPLPFMLGWALGVTALIDSPSLRGRWMLAAGVASLLASAAVYPPTALMIPVFGAATVVAFLRAHSWRLRDARPALSVVVAALVAVLAVGVATAGTLQEPSPQAFPGAAPVVEWLRTVAWQRAATVSQWFWNFYLPSHLFLNPDAPARCGMFLTATVIPMVAGIHALFRAEASEQRYSVLRVITVAACIGAPLAAAITSPPPLDDRALIVVPFGVLLAVYGSIRMWTSGIAGRILVATVCLAAAAQAFVSLKSI